VRGQLALDFDADSLNALDPLLGWVAAELPTLRPTPVMRRGGTRRWPARHGYSSGSKARLDSLALHARASVERLAWRAWRVPAGRGRFTWQPGPVPTFVLDATLDSIAHGVFGFSGATAAGARDRDSLTWLARSRIGEGAAFLAGGRFARSAGPTGDAVLAVRRRLPGAPAAGRCVGARRPTELTVTTPRHRDRAGAPERVRIGQAGARGSPADARPADAHLQLEGFPLVALYALFERDTAGVGGRSRSRRTFGYPGQPRLERSFSLFERARSANFARHLWTGRTTITTGGCAGRSICGARASRSDVQTYLRWTWRRVCAPAASSPTRSRWGPGGQRRPVVLEALTPALNR